MDDTFVVADVGGTSSRWAWWCGDGPVQRFPAPGDAALQGFNPVQGDGATFAREVHAHLREVDKDVFRARHVHVYGAGCGAPQRADRMHAVLAPLFHKADITVDTDLLGAARGLFGHEEGLVLILGTGMNAGHYDGRQLHRPMPSLGFILGDEGSGADIGRHLLREAFYRRVPVDLHHALFGSDGPPLEHVLQEVYRSDRAARSLAARSKTLSEHIAHPWAKDLVRERFRALARLLAAFFPGDTARVRATGSVAWVFGDLLKEALLEAGIELGTVVRDPMDGLVAYHRAHPPTA